MVNLADEIVMDDEIDEYLSASDMCAPKPVTDVPYMVSDSLSSRDRSAILSRRIAEIERSFPFLSIADLPGRESGSKPNVP